MKVNISVDEPWNFEGPDGENIIKGTIIKNLSPTTLIFKANHVQSFEQGKGNLFRLRARHYHEILVHRNIFGRIYYEGTFNAALLPQEDDPDNPGPFVFIGSFI